MSSAFKKIFKRHREDEARPAPVRFNPEPGTGLTKEQIMSRVDDGFINMVSDSSSVSAKDIVRRNIFTYFNFIFLIIAAVLLYEKSYNNLTFLVVVVVNTVIGIVQELRSKKMLEELQFVSSPESTVIREGKAQRVPSEQLVLDDIVIFSAGNQICADATVCVGELTVNESLVTGESDEIKKKPGDSLLSGSFVVSGKAKARLDSVGDDAFAAKLARDAKKIRKKQEPGMMKSLTRLIQIIGIVIIPFAVLMFINQYKVLGLSEKVSVENTAASVIGMIPEGLYLLTSLALAASTIRLARNKTLVHEMKCIETLARVDVLCVDKTGTITEPQMKVEKIIDLSDEGTEDCSGEIADFVGNINADNETMKALKAQWADKPPKRKALRTRGFSSATKYSAADFGPEGAYILGAPEMIVPDSTEDLRNMIAEHSSMGERVLLFASYEYEKDSPEDIFQGGSLGEVVIPMALIVMSNAIRPQAKETFEYFRQQGVTVKVISGDNPMTASMAAQKAGIQNADVCIDASVLKTDADVEKAASAYTVFGRVTPDQKRQLVRSLKKAGHTVAMTGDGVNDVLALKDADCSIAMASGSEAAANISDLVLLNSDFSNMPRVVAEGRRVINNIERSASLYLVKNIFAFILSLISLISVSLYPLKPVQLSLISAFMIGIPSFFLALEPNHELVKGKFLRNVLYRALPAALTSVLLVEWALLFVNVFHISPEKASTMCLLLYALSAYLMLYRVCKPMNVWHVLLFILMGAGFIGTMLILPGWFQITALDLRCALILSPLCLLVLPIDYAFHRVLDTLALWKNKTAEFFRRKIEEFKSRKKKETA